VQWTVLDDVVHCFVMGSGHVGTVECCRVAVVDDDESVRESLPDLLKQFGLRVRAFSSAEQFLSSDCVDLTECLIVDIHMPGMSGLDLQRALEASGRKIPIVFITAQREESIWSRAIQQGAVKILLKPFSETALLEAVNLALEAA
jgi:FixJ family two-component response regulator